MNFTRKLTTLLLAVSIGLMYSCSNEMNFQLPQGPEGPQGIPGLSAYELWVDAVMKGLEDPKNPGTMWPTDMIEINDFFRFLTGANGLDGTDGIDGIDGTDGLSAYELWLKGVEDKTIDWDGGTELSDFWLFLKGNDGAAGLSAYQIWVDEVEKGNIVDKDGNTWSDENISLLYFWDYLSGADGSVGADGKSAFELWQDQIADPGLVDPFNPNDMWDPELNDILDFWKYLRGKDGEKGDKGDKGDTGEKGDDGLSAYQLWVKAVDDGLKDPHDPTGTKNWPEDKIGLEDFWDYLGGTQGLSAYDIWVIEVGKGLVNPKDPNGGNWPDDKTTEADFLDYLRGADGEKGDPGEPGPVGPPGQPGTPIEIISGYYNVIAQYSDQAYNEYVDPETGAVTYRVYDKEGNAAPGAVVSGLPGMDPTIEYTADEYGCFTVPKEELPDELPEDERMGSTASVTYNNDTKESAPNTYVPNRIEIRLYANHTPFLATHNLVIPFEIQRKVDGEWEPIPYYLKGAYQKMIVYEVSANGPTPYDKLRSKVWSSSVENVKEVYRAYTGRNTIRRDYISESCQELHYGGIWDGNRHYVTVAVDGFYGEAPYLNSAVEIPPMQIMPRVVNLNVFEGNTDDTFSEIWARFLVGDVVGMADDNIDPEHFYSKLENVTVAGDYDRWDAVKRDVNEIIDLPLFRITLSKYVDNTQGTVSVSNQGNECPLGDPYFDIAATFYLGSYCNLACTANTYFRSFETRIFIMDVSKTNPDRIELRVVDNRALDYVLDPEEVLVDQQP